jgi:hypothetical protein
MEGVHRGNLVESMNCLVSCYGCLKSLLSICELVRYGAVVVIVVFSAMYLIYRNLV